MELTVDQPLESLGIEKITSLDVAKSLTVPDGAVYALIQAQTKNVLWRDDEANPTAGNGFILNADGSPLYYTGQLTKLRFLESEANGVLMVSYYRPLSLVR